MPPKTRGSKKAASDSANAAAAAAAATAGTGTLRTTTASRRAASANKEANVPSTAEVARGVPDPAKEKRRGRSRTPSGDEGGAPLSQQYSQLSQNRDPNWILLFVLPTGLTEATCDPNLSVLYLMCCDMDLTCTWISEEDTLQHVPKVGNIFVLSPFEGRAFDRLLRLWEKNKIFEIVGPQCLKYSLQSKEECRIQSKQVPAFTLGMRNMLVTLTGVPLEEKEALVKKIQLMNGCVSNIFTQAVTHVVAGIVTSEKCLRAYENQIPVMTCKWVEEVWKDSQIELIHATDSKYVKFACPVFHNLVICISQVSNRIKAILGDIINQNGGKYSAELKRQDTNVLVVPSDEGSKFAYAYQWKIPCVTPEWVEASKSAGHVVPFELFKVERVEPSKIVISTPKNSQIGKNGNLNSSSSSIAYAAGTERLVETFCSTGGRPSAADAVHSKNEETLEILRKAAEHGPYLDGCTVYVCGWKTSVSENLKKMINASGATRLNKLNVKVTHVLVIDRLPEDDADALRNLEQRPFVVSFDWVIQSAKQNSPADEDTFTYELRSQSRISDTKCSQLETSSVSAKSSIRDLVENKSKSGELKSEDIVMLLPNVASPVSGSNKKNSSIVDVEDGSDASNISPVACEPENNLLVENLTPHAKMPVGNLGKTSTPSNAVDMPHENSQEKDTQFSSLNLQDGNSSNVFPFTGMKFKVMLNSESETKEVKQLIEQANGKVVSVSGNCEVVILPAVFSPQLVVDPLTKRLTKFWVMDVINNESLDVEELFYHKPLPEYSGMDAILMDVVVGTSNYSNNEKEYISTVVRAMGGVYQDIFARKPSKQHKTLRSTHLICPITDNEKYRAAKKWGTPVAIFDWILDSHANKRKVDIASYNPEFAKSDTDFTVSYMPRTPKHIEGSRAKHHKLDKESGLSSVPSSNSKFKPVRLTNDKDEVTFIRPTSRAMGSGKKPAASGTLTGAAAAKRVLPPVPGLAEDDPMCQSESFVEYYHNVYKPMLDAMAPEVMKETEKSESFIEYYEKVYKPAIEANKTPDKEDSYIVEGFTRSESRNIKKHFREVGNNSPDMRVMRAGPPPITPLSVWMAKRMAETLDKNPVCEDSFWGRSTPKSRSSLASRKSTSSESEVPAANRSLKRSSESSLEEDESSLIFKVKKKVRLSVEEESGGIGSTSMEQSSIPSISPRENGSGNSTVEVEGEDEVMEVAPDGDDAAKEPLPRNECTIFRNVKAWIAKDCKDYKCLSASVKQLGGNVVENTAEVVVTHIIVESDRTEAGKITTLFPKAKLVSPQWIRDCEAQKTRINEYDYKPVASSKQSMQFLCHLLAEDDNTQNREYPLKPESSKQKRSSPRLTKKNKFPSSNELKIQPHEVDAPDVIWDDEENKNVNIQHHRPGTSTDTDAVVNGVEKKSWEQGRSRHASAEPTISVQHQSTNKTTPSKIPTSAKAKRVGNVKETNKEDLMVPVPKGSIFMMSGGAEGWKKQATDIVTALKGSMTPKPSFDSDAIALVAGSLARSEKVLGCVASGKCLLKMSYLLDSSKANQFLPITEKYIWQASDGNSPLETQIAKLGYQWFCRFRQNPEDRPMNNMTFYIHEPHAGRKQSYATLIQIGGGSVVGNPNEAKIILANGQLPANVKVNPDIPIKQPLFLNELLIGVVGS